MTGRRQFLMGTATLTGGFLLASQTTLARLAAAAESVGKMTPEEAARDESLWAELRKAFTPEPGHSWFNCLALNPASTQVHEAFVKYDNEVSRWPLAHAAKVFGTPQKDALRARLANLINASGEEIALLRNATEALVTVISGFDLAAGDEVVVSEQDYEPILNSWYQLERRHRIILRKVTAPTPVPHHDQLVEAYRQAITPRTRVVACSHIAAGTGQIFPVRRIADLAHAAGAQMLVDGALSFGCIPVDVQEMNCDYYATSLHKGTFAPTGSGFLYVRKERIASLWPLYGAPVDRSGDIRKFEYRGTAPVTALAAVNDALDVHGKIGVERFAARYRYLKRLWADRLAGESRFRLSARLEPEHSCGILSVSLDGTDTRALDEHLWSKRSLSSYPVEHGLWISPYPFTTPTELDALATTLLEVAKKGLPA
jgi:isopenicillin-N epimerase